jgi:HAD superfamily hydrolase (TIGR01459 family)
MLTGELKIISGLREIAGEYDAIVCDVWGVVHDGIRAFPAACEALRRFRETRGKVVLLSNAPRPPAEVGTQLARFGMVSDCYDAIVTSGGAARDDLAARAAGGTLKLMHIGPERDKPIYAGLEVELVGPEKAEVVLLSGLDDQDTETPADYVGKLEAVRKRDLVAICANPDILVPIGGKIVYCAGAIAREYEKIGGHVVYYGKPHLPIYGMALKEAAPGTRVLAIGDALETDIEGAARARLDALMVAGGLHAGEIGALTAGSLAAFLAGKTTTVRAGIAMLAW